MSEALRRNAIGGQIQRLREKALLTQQDFAARCQIAGFEIGRETISQIERHVRGVSDLEMILMARALRVNIEELIPLQLPKWRKDLRPPKAIE